MKKKGRLVPPVIPAEELPAGFGGDTFLARGSSMGCIEPNDRQELVDLVRYAARKHLTLWPISRGRNIGYGGAMSFEQERLHVSLARLDRIEQAESSDVVSVEPGVTFQMISSYLKRSRKMVAMTGAPKGASVMANALQYGLMAGERGDRTRHIAAIETISPRGMISLVEWPARHAASFSDSIVRPPFLPDGTIALRLWHRLVPKCDEAVEVVVGFVGDEFVAGAVASLIEVERSGLLFDFAVRHMSRYEPIVGPSPIQRGPEDVSSSEVYSARAVFASEGVPVSALGEQAKAAARQLMSIKGAVLLSGRVVAVDHTPSDDDLTMMLGVADSSTEDLAVSFGGCARWICVLLPCAGDAFRTIHLRMMEVLAAAEEPPRITVRPFDGDWIGLTLILGNEDIQRDTALASLECELLDIAIENGGVVNRCTPNGRQHLARKAS